MFQCNHFAIQELVSPDVYYSRGEKAWSLLDERALETLDQLRDKFGSITVNDWLWGGEFKYSGLREPQCNVGADFSQHRFGRAFDCKFKNHSAEYVRSYILANPEEFPHISSIELDTSWLHFDVRNHGPGILTFKP